MIGKLNPNKTSSSERLHSAKKDEVNKALPSPGKTLPGGNAGPATIDVSSKASMFVAAMAHLNDLGDVREDVVANFKQQVEAGSYIRTDDDIANAIVRDES